MRKKNNGICLEIVISKILSESPLLRFRKLILIIVITGILYLISIDPWVTPYIVRKINNKIYNGNTHSLVEATRQGREELVRQMLDHGGDINSQDRNGMSSLMFAAKNGDTEMVRLLLNYNPDLNLNEFNTGNTAIRLAEKYNHREVVELLRNAGATE